MWKRPVLCRLCECPASDGGVRIDQLDALKLSEWWRLTIGEEFVPEETPGQGEVICQFCLWDARLEHEYSINVSRDEIAADCDWWSGHDDNQFFRKFYYLDNIIQQFSVMLDGPDSKKTITTDISHGTKLEETEQESSKKVYECFLCTRSLASQKYLVQHMQKLHPGQFILCKHNGKCCQVFQTEEEKTKHVLEVSRLLKKCNLCHKMYNHKYTTSHLKMHHKGENFVRCSYRLCSLFFCSEEERQKHENLIHTGGNKQKCIFCSLLFLKSGYRKHLKRVHNVQLPSTFTCTFKKCTIKYFLTETERDQHVISFHNRVFVRQDAECIYCNKVFLDKQLLYQHINYSHSDIKIQCKIHKCFQYFHTQTDYDAHFEEKHRKLEEKKKFQCSKCNYRTDIKWDFNMHVTRNHGAKNKQCPKCTKCYSSSESLKKHIKTHEEPKLCQYCKKKISNLCNHQRQVKCKNCQQVLMCRRSGKLHRKNCITIKTLS